MIANCARYANSIKGSEAIVEPALAAAPEITPPADALAPEFIPACPAAATVSIYKVWAKQLN